MKFFDAALRADLRSEADFANLAYFGLCGALFVAPRGARSDSAERVIDRFERTRHRAEAYAAEHRVPAGVGLGLIARSAPRRAHPEVRVELEKLAAKNALSAVGPIEWPDESEVAQWQLELAAAHGLPVLVELPPRLGSAVVGTLFEAAAAAGVAGEQLVVVGVDFTNVRSIADRGAYTVADLSPAGLGWEAAADLVERYQRAISRRMMLSASAHASFDVLAAARFAERLRNSKLNPDELERILWGNAIDAFSLR